MSWKIYLSLDEKWNPWINVELYEDKPTLFPIPIIHWKYPKGSKEFEQWDAIKQRMIYDQYKSFCREYERKCQI